MLGWLTHLSEKKRIIFLFLTALFFRLAYFLFILYRNAPEGFLVYDSYGYIQIASNLVDNGTFSQSFLSPLEPDYFRTPVYPLFLSLFKITGTNLWVTVVIQIILASLTSVIIYKISRSLLLPVSAATLAALIFCIEPSSICFSTLILTESFFVLIFSWAIYYLINFIHDRKPGQLYLFALLFGIATLTRPAPVYLAFVLFPFLLFIRKTMWKTVVMGMAIFILILSPWFIRTAVTFGKPFLTKLDDEMLLFYHASSIISEKENISLNEAQSKLRRQVLDEFEGDPKTEIILFAPFVRDKAMEIIRDNTGIYIRQHIYGVLSIAFKPVRGYFDAQAGYVKGYQSITPGEFPANQKIRTAFFAVSSGFSIAMVIVQVLILGFCYIFIFNGIRMLRIENLYAALIFILIIFYFLNMVVPPFSEGRLRLPLMPLLIITGTAGFYSWRQKRSLKI